MLHNNIYLYYIYYIHTTVYIYIYIIDREGATVGGLVGLVLATTKDNISVAQKTFVMALGFNLVSILSTALMLIPKAFERHEYLTDEAKERRSRIEQQASQASSPHSSGSTRPQLRRAATDFSSGKAGKRSKQVCATTDDIGLRHTVAGAATTTLPSLQKIPSSHELIIANGD